MRSIAALTSLIVLILAAVLVGPSLEGAPIEAVFAKGVKVPAEGWITTMRFRGGERASVQVAPGAEGGSSPVEITVHDAKGNKIASDKGRPTSPDFAVVFWYPPRDGEYKITISSVNPDVYYVVIQ
jgi:hypothetical protein